jgi:hypothetical protein
MKYAKSKTIHPKALQRRALLEKCENANGSERAENIEHLKKYLLREPNDKIVKKALASYEAKFLAGHQPGDDGDGAHGKDFPVQHVTTLFRAKVMHTVATSSTETELMSSVLCVKAEQYDSTWMTYTSVI